eukprot:8326911-Lingulodinium_polyedra.AAC.1
MHKDAVESTVCNCDGSGTARSRTSRACQFSGVRVERGTRLGGCCLSAARTVLGCCLGAAWVLLGR